MSHTQKARRGPSRRRDGGGALPEPEARFRALVQHATDVIAVLDADGTIRYASPAVEAVLGYRPEERLGAGAFDLIHPDDVAGARRLLGHLLEAPGSVVQIALRLRHRGGDWRHLEVTAKNLLDDPAVGGIVVNYRDATERRRAEEALAASERRFRAGFERSVLGIALADTAGVVIESNPALRRMLGYEAAELRGLGIHDLTHPEDVAPNLDLLAELLAGRRDHYTLEKRYRHRAGHVVWGRLTVSALPDAAGRPQFLVGMVEDIDQRKQAEAALHRQNAYLTALHDTTLALLHRRESTGLLRDIVARAGALVGTPDGYIYLLEPDEAAMVASVGTGIFREGVGNRIARGEGIGGRVWATGQPLAVEEYDAWPGRKATLPAGRFHAIAGVPLTAAGRVVGVIGLAHVAAGRRFGAEELAILARFGELASLALENARLHEAARRELAEREAAEAALRRSEREYRHLFERANDAILLLEPDGEVVLDANARACALYGLPRERLLGLSLRALSQDPARGDRYREALLAAGAIEGFEAVQRRADGAPLQLRINASLVEYRGRPAILSVNRDVGPQKALEARLAHQAFHDPLTDLPNRALFMDRLAQALARAARRGDGVAVLFLDLDRFKVVNDSLGHAAGDRLLVAVAGRLAAGLRPGDTASRLGGDEFTILLEGLDGPEDAAVIAERLGAALAAPVPLEGHAVHVTASVGIAFSAGGDADADALLRRADAAMYRAKRRGRGHHERYCPGLDAGRGGRLALEGELRQALERGELRVHYQPQVDLATGRVAGLEALARWRHPARGLLAPGVFIPLAEETGLILPLGRWVLVEACRQARRWGARRGGARPPVVSVNLSPRQFLQPGLADDVAGILRATGADPRALQLELTEGVLLEHTGATTATLEQLKTLGVGLAIDDFGTGYASLGYLRQFPLDTLKIDRSFVAALEGDDGAALVEAMVTLAHRLGLRTVAEGVETAAQADRLRALGCDLGQGWLFAKPSPARAAGRLLRQALVWPGDEPRE